MSISKTQINIKRDETIQKLLQKGIHPSSYEVSNILEEHFDKNIPGLPYYKPIKAQEHESSDPGAYNQMFKNLGLDMDVIYRASLDQTKKILMTEEYYLAEKEIVQAALDKLQLRLDNIQDALNSGKVTQNHCQVFDNFYNIEFNGDGSRNIPYTNAFVDLIQKKVYNEKVSLAYDKYDLSEASIDIRTLSPYISLEDSANKETVLKDTVNEFYTYIVNTNTEKGIKISIDVAMKEVKDASSLSISFTTSKTIKGYLSISEDGVNYTELYATEGTSMLEWNFNTTPVKYIRILLEKKEPDGMADNIFQYYFIVKNISVINETFDDKSIYVSKPIEFNDIIDTITLKANDLVFPNTQIYYYIGLDNDVDKINWQIIENNEPYNLGLLNYSNKIINHIEPGFATKSDSSDPNLYRVCKLPSNVNINSVKLSPGYQMWYMEVTDVADTGFDLSKFNYDSDKVESIKFVDNEQYTLSVQTGKVYMLTQYVYCEDDTTIEDKGLNIKGAANNNALQSLMIVNGNEIKSANGRYHFRLKKGRNKVILLFYVATSAGSSVNIVHNINFKEHSFDVYSDPTLKLTSIHSLKYKIDIGDRRYFAIDKDGYVVVKHNPLTASLSNDCTGIRYMLEYKSLKAEARKVMVTKNGQPCVKFRIMATLLSAEKDLSPQILSYRIIGQ